MSNFERNYVNPSAPASFGGVSKTYDHNADRLTTNQIKEELSNIEAYQGGREVKKPTTNPFLVYFIRQQIQMDLCDIRALAHSNDGFKYLFVAIDMFSKFVFCMGMRSKKAHESVSVMKEMIKCYDPNPKEVLSDNGSEFIAASVRRYIKSQNVKQRFTRSEIKCGGVERVNRTIQSKIYKYMAQNGTDRYIDVLPQLIHSYNNTLHRTIQITPALAELEENHLWVRSHLLDFYKRKKRRKPKFKVGDVVRIEVERTVFRRGYRQLFKPELFVIDEVNARLPIPVYKLWSLEKDDNIEGSFYSNELNKVGNPRKVERILERRKKDNVEEVKVRWKGFHEVFDSWVPESSI